VATKTSKAKEKLKVPAPNGKPRAMTKRMALILPITPPKATPQIDKPTHLSVFPPSVITVSFSTNRGDLPHDLFILDAAGNVVVGPFPLKFLGGTTFSVDVDATAVPSGTVLTFRVVATSEALDGSLQGRFTHEIDIAIR
jgi:hypothetical protein